MIASNPFDYQVCEGCESIVGSGTVICPNCHGYRFDNDPVRVVDQALILGSRVEDGTIQAYDEQGNLDGLTERFDTLEMRDLPEIPEDFMGEIKDPDYQSSLSPPPLGWSFEPMFLSR